MTTFRNIKNMANFEFIFLPGKFIKLNEREAMGEDGKRINVNPNEEINESHNRPERKRDRRHRS